MTVALPRSRPEKGQLVAVRSRNWIVTEVAPSTLPPERLQTGLQTPQHLLTLSSVEDDGLGESASFFTASVHRVTALESQPAGCCRTRNWPELKMHTKIAEEIKQDFYKQNFPNDGQRFVAWYLRNIHLRDMNQTKAEITDGADDKQIDAIFVDDDNSTIYIVQGKFVGVETIDAEPLREVLSSWIQLKDLVRLQETANNKLKQRLSEVAIAMDDDYDVALELVTTGTLSPAARDDLATFQAQLAKADDFPASIHVVDEDELKRRYELALDRENPLLSHTLQLQPGKFLSLELAGTRVVLASIPLKDCITFPGIKDGTLFQKNVRQSLGLNNAVNKGIKTTIYGNSRDFFFYHNGITAICNQMELTDTGLFKVRGVSVVNGCQSLNTILSCSEKVKTLDNAYVMFRFYEIPQRDRADKISISTNSQSPVKPRDLRSNDKRVLALKKLYEQKYPQGCLTTKRGEQASANKDKGLVVDLADLGKFMITWHSQRPNIAYSEQKLFDKYFEQLFKRDYKPENMHALAYWMREVLEALDEREPAWVERITLGDASLCSVSPSVRRLAVLLRGKPHGRRCAESRSSARKSPGGRHCRSGGGHGRDMPEYGPGSGGERTPTVQPGVQPAELDQDKDLSGWNSTGNAAVFRNAAVDARRQRPEPEAKSGSGNGRWAIRGTMGCGLRSIARQ